MPEKSSGKVELLLLCSVFNMSLLLSHYTIYAKLAIAETHHRQGKRIKPRRATLGCNRRSMKLLAACLGGLFSSSFPALSNLKPCDASLPCFPRCDPYGYAHSLRENSCREPRARESHTLLFPRRLQDCSKKVVIQFILIQHPRGRAEARQSTPCLGGVDFCFQS